MGTTTTSTSIHDIDDLKVEVVQMPSVSYLRFTVNGHEISVHMAGTPSVVAEQFRSLLTAVPLVDLSDTPLAA